LQEAKSYSLSEQEFSYSPEMDKVRKLILSEMERQKASLAEWSKAIGKNHAYLQQFVHRGVPAELPEKARRALAKVSKIPESKLTIDGRRVVPIGHEFEPDPPAEKVVTENDKPFPDALPQMLGRMGAGSTGAVITIDVGEMQSREEVGEWWRIPPAVLRGLARSDVSRTIGFSMDGADSMEPTILRTDIVFVDTGRQDIEPDGIWALDYGLGRTLKRVSIRKRDGDTFYVIKSDNKAYPDEEYHADEVTVFGRFIGRFSVF